MLPDFVKGAGQRFGIVTGTRQVVAVLGMHRSGTSLLANLLTVLGVDLGDRLLAADVNNQAGYWEQEEIKRTQEAALRQLGRHWVGPSGTIPFATDWWTRPDILPLKAQLTAIVATEMAQARGIWGFKDPRTSRLLPLWNEIFAELGVEPVYLLAVRDPAMVVESVVRRENLPRARVELLWLLHNLDAIRDAGRSLRLVVDYDRWFTHPAEQARAIVQALDIKRPAAEDGWLVNIRERIRPDLRHCKGAPEIPLPFVAELYDALKEASASGSLPERITRIDAEVRRSLALCEPWAAVVDELAGRPTGPQFSFIDHVADARLEPLGATAKVEVWDASIDGPSVRALLLHPPARLHFTVPDGRRARLTFAASIHPHTWNDPKAGGCEFVVAVNGAMHSSVKLDPANIASDRCWHECALDIPEGQAGSHDVTFETRALGGSFDLRWAIWREPRLTWDAPAPSSAAGLRPHA